MTQTKSTVSDSPSSGNPYETQASLPEFNPTNGHDAEKVRIKKIASGLRRVNIAILLYLCLVPINMLFVTAGEKFPFEGLSLVAIPLFIFGFGAFAVYKLAILLRGKTIAILCAIGLLVPLFGFLVLLAIRHLGSSELIKNVGDAGLLVPGTEKH